MSFHIIITKIVLSNTIYRADSVLDILCKDYASAGNPGENAGLHSHAVVLAAIHLKQKLADKYGYAVGKEIYPGAGNNLIGAKGD